MLKKIPSIDLLSLAQSYSNKAMKQAQEDIDRTIRKYKQNHEVLTKLINAGFCKPEVMQNCNVTAWEDVLIKKSQLTKLRLVIGPVLEDGKRLHDAKKRIIRVRLKLVDYPDSTIYIDYLRPYPKSEEANCPCKIMKVEVVSAQPAREARFEPQLVCNQE